MGDAIAPQRRGARVTRDHQLALATVFGVVVALGAAGLVQLRQREQARMVERPAATGELGVIHAFAQLPERGPVLLRVGAEQLIPSPQSISFQWSVEGTGPRYVRVVTEDERGATVQFELSLTAPAAMENLPRLLEIDDAWPHRFDILITVEAPHAAAVTARFPIRRVPRSVWRG